MEINLCKLVSVLIPVYNHALFVEQCLDSVKFDGWPSIELIILDDGSSDASFERAKRWVDINSHFFERVVLERQENSGVVRTLNSLVRESTGEFVVLLASDDYLLPGSIQARVDYLEKHAEKSAVFCDALGVDVMGQRVFGSVISEKYFAKLNRLETDSRLAKELIFRWCVPGPVFMARREVYEEFGLYDESYLIEDRYFYLRLLAAGKLGFLNKVVAGYRIHDNSSTGSIEGRRLVGLEVLRIERGVLKYFRGFNKFYLLLVIFGNSSLLKKYGPISVFRFFCARILSIFFRFL